MIGVKFVAADHKNRIHVPVANSMLYSCIKYKIIFACRPKLATFSNVSFAAHTIFTQNFDQFFERKTEVLYIKHL